MKVFGPIPSRRLGRSLGINHIPPKICTYSCAYCQQGYSSKMQSQRDSFYEATDIFNEVKEKLDQLQAKGENIDYLSFVPDGEPTLDKNLGQMIELLKPLGIKIAVITNSSLLWREDVRTELALADLVSVKLDAADEKLWRKIDHPLRDLSLDIIMDGILLFAEKFKGELLTETMLVKGINDNADCLEQTASFLAKAKPSRAYLTVPTRPPADKRVMPPDESGINLAYQIYKKHLSNVEYLIGYEGNDFAFSGNVEEDLLSITSVHPMRKDAIESFLLKAGSSWDFVEKLLTEQKLVELNFDGKLFYMRKLYPNYKR